MPGPSTSVFDCYVGDDVLVTITTRDAQRRSVVPQTMEAQFGLDGETEARSHPNINIDRVTGRATFTVTPESPGVWAYSVHVTAPVVTTGEGFIRAKERMFE